LCPDKLEMNSFWLGLSHFSIVAFKKITIKYFYEADAIIHIVMINFYSKCINDVTICS